MQQVNKEMTTSQNERVLFSDEDSLGAILLFALFFGKNQENNLDIRHTYNLIIMDYNMCITITQCKEEIELQMNFFD